MHGDFEAARTLYDRALKAGTGHAQIRLNRAVLHLLIGNLTEGWRDYAARTDIPNKVPVTDLTAAGMARRRRLKKTRLLVRAEQGVGDQIMFASLFANSARAAGEGGSVILECDARLVPLFARSFPDAHVMRPQLENRRRQRHCRLWLAEKAGGANAVILMGSLPRCLRKSLEAFPKENAYLEARSRRTGAVAWHFRGAAAHRRSSASAGAAASPAAIARLQYAPLAAWAEFLRDLPGTIVSRAI